MQLLIEHCARRLRRSGDLSSGILAAALLCVGPIPLSAQVDFSRIISVRELPSGSLLVSDDIDNRVALVDLAAGSVRDLARVGSGPGEFRRAGRLIAIGRDSTIAVDAFNGRALLFRDATMVATLAPDHPTIRAVGLVLVGGDGRGNVAGLRTSGATTGVDGTRRSLLHLVRASLVTGHVDTIAQLRGADLRISRSGSSTAESFRATGVAFSVPEQAVLFADGWLAVARVDPYRIEWFDSEGRLTKTTPGAWAPPPVTQVEKVAWRERALRSSTRRSQLNIETMTWAAQVSPFRTAGLLATPSGALVAHRPEWSGGRGNEYDVYPRSGEPVFIRLPEAQRIVGFGSGVAYVAESDSDGIERIKRIAWPH